MPEDIQLDQLCYQTTKLLSCVSSKSSKLLLFLEEEDASTDFTCL